MASVNWRSFVRSLNTKFDAPVKEHLKNVYSCVAISTLAAAAGGYVHVFTGILQGGFLSTMAALGLLIALMTTPDNGKNRTMRLGFLVGFAFASGLGLGPMLDAVIRINPAILPNAFMSTALVFICFTLCAMYSEQRKWLYLGGTLMSGLSMLFLLSLGYLVFSSPLLFQLHLYLGLAVFCGFILYDTQLIIEKRRRGDRDYIRHSVDLFVDLIDLFRHLLILLTQKEQNKRSNKD